MVDLASPAPKNRLEASDRNGGLRRKPEGGPAELTPRHKLLAEYMVHGVAHQDICDRIFVERPIATNEGTGTLTRHPRPHEPLTLLEAADLLRIKRRNARELSTLPIFKSEYQRQIELFRDSERARNLHTYVEIRDNPGLGKAADRKVRLQAAGLLNNDLGGASSVTVNLGPQITAGIVIDLRDDEEVEPPIIEHEVTP